jgi:hypothetical protein
MHRPGQRVCPPLSHHRPSHQRHRRHTKPLPIPNPRPPYPPPPQVAPPYAIWAAVAVATSCRILLASSHVLVSPSSTTATNEIAGCFQCWPSSTMSPNPPSPHIQHHHSPCVLPKLCRSRTSTRMSSNQHQKRSPTTRLIF